MYGQFRLSRFSYPRATWWVMLLIAVVFLAFGLFAEAWLPQAGNGVAQPFGNALAPNWVAQVFDRLVGF
jgi:hypothetical protein